MCCCPLLLCIFCVWIKIHSKHNVRGLRYGFSFVLSEYGCTERWGDGRNGTERAKRTFGNENEYQVVRLNAIYAFHYTIWKLCKVDLWHISTTSEVSCIAIQFSFMFNIYYRLSMKTMRMGIATVIIVELVRWNVRLWILLLFLHDSYNLLIHRKWRTMNIIAFFRWLI